MRALWHKVIKGLRVAADPRFRHGLRHGVAASIEHLGPLGGASFATVIDVGAHRGQFTLLAAGLFPDARIFAFEPLADAFAVLRALVSQPRLQAFNVAIAPTTGELPMHVAIATDSSSLLPITERQTTLFADTRLARIDRVRVGPLDSFIGADQLIAPTLLKVDVQGYELQVLEASASLLAQIDTIYVEASFVTLYQGQALADQIIDHLHALGFRLVGVYNLIADGGQAIQADLLFRRPHPGVPRSQPGDSSG